MLHNVSAAFGEENVKKGLKGGSETGSSFLESFFQVMEYLIGFGALVAVIIFMWAGFQIFFAGGDEDKVKKGKRTMIYCLLGLLIMFMAWTIVSFLTTGLEKAI